MKRLKNYYLIKLILLILVLSLLLISCKQDPSTLRTYHPPENINDGLEVGSIEEVNIDLKLIEQAINDIKRGKYGEVHSMLIYKDGKLVVEEYFAGHKYQWGAPNHYGDMIVYTRSTPHTAHSVTKSITSACIGIAIDNGFIDSVSQSIFDYLPDHQDLNAGGKDKITIEHLLTMTSGLKWDEWSVSLSSIENDMIGIWFDGQKDPIRYVLERKLVSEPGTSFNYSGGDMFILGEIIKNASGMHIDEFSGKYLFKPLGIDTYDWYIRYENGEIDTASSLIIKPIDMAKIGITFLNNGVFNEKWIISKQWVEKSASSYPDNTGIKIPGEDLGKVGYSYTWWTKEYSSSGMKVNGYWANGWGGQKIMVFPEIKSVIVFTGGNWTSKVQILNILEKYIFPAID